MTKGKKILAHAVLILASFLSVFTRYAGDSFPYEEVKQIIEKRMREEVYDSLVQDLLRGPADRP